METGSQQNQSNESTTTRVRERATGWILFVGIFVFYLIQIPRFAAPGRWAEMLVSFSGLDPFRPLIHPLWTAWMSGLAASPVGDIVFWASVTSAAAGASLCLMLYACLLHVPIFRGYKASSSELEVSARRVAGITAALMAAVSSPMLLASTRGDFLGLSLLLLVLAIYPSLLYSERPRLSLMFASAGLMGLAAAEYPGTLPILPIYAVWWLLLGWKKMPNPWAYLLTAAGLLLLLWFAVTMTFAVHYAHSDLAAWRNVTSLGEVLQVIGRSYFSEAAYSVPKVGWLLILCTTVLPFFLVMFRRGGEATDFFTRMGQGLLNLMLYVLAVTLLFDLPGSPVRLAGSRLLLLAPSIITAVWVGSLLATHYAKLAGSSRVWLRHLPVAAVTVLVVIAAVRQCKAADSSAYAPIASFARELVRDLDGRAWLVSDGTLDASIRLAAREAGMDTRFLQAEFRPASDRARYYESLFTNSALRSLASAGVKPLLAAWKSSDPRFAEKVAALVPPSIFDESGYRAVPMPTHVRLYPEDALPSPDELLAAHQRYWASVPVPDLQALPRGQPGWLAAFFVARWSSRLANDLGVYLEDHQQPESARKAYHQALVFWHDNMSAALNLLAIARRNGEPDAEEWKALLDKQAENNRRLFDLRFVPQLCGIVRTTAAGLEEAAVLSRSGDRQQALARLEQAGLLLEAGDDAARLAMARLYLENEAPAQSESILKELLEQQPDNVAALSGLLRVAVHEGDIGRAETLLDQLVTLGVDSDTIALERVRLLLRAGKTGPARERLLTLTRGTKIPVEVWYNLAVIGLLDKDKAAWEMAAPKLESSRYYLPGLLLLSDYALRERNLDRARSYLEQALSLDAANQRVLERLIQVHYAERNVLLLRDRSAQLLALSPDQPAGLFGMANVHLAQQRLDLAEATYRRLLALRESAQSLNDLAWILGERGQLDEALALALRATQMNPTDGNYWDTLATVYSKRGEKELALAAVDKALAQSERRSPTILINAGRIYAESGKEDKSLQVLDLLMNVRSVLPPARAQEVDELSRKLGASR